jgi:hypothetical protein
MINILCDKTFLWVPKNFTFVFDLLIRNFKIDYIFGMKWPRYQRVISLKIQIGIIIVLEPPITPVPPQGEFSRL